jgi:lysophospholipase L1-like esterase
VQRLTEVFTTGFLENEWKDVFAVILLVGTNDVERGRSHEFKIKYRALVKIIQARLGQVHIVLCGIPPRPKDEETLGEKTRLFNRIILAVAQELKLVHHPLYKAFLSHGQLKLNYFCKDGLHLSPVAERLVAKVVKMYRTRFLCH